MRGGCGKRGVVGGGGKDRWGGGKGRQREKREVEKGEVREGKGE